MIDTSGKRRESIDTKNAFVPAYKALPAQIAFSKHRYGPSPENHTTCGVFPELYRKLASPPCKPVDSKKNCDFFYKKTIDTGNRSVSDDSTLRTIDRP